MQDDNVITYATCKLRPHEKTCLDHNLETIGFALKAWRHYLYVERCEVFIDKGSLKCLFT